LLVELVVDVEAGDEGLTPGRAFVALPAELVVWEAASVEPLATVCVEPASFDLLSEPSPHAAAPSRTDSATRRISGGSLPVTRRGGAR
jgi:hypothetical protein